MNPNASRTCDRYREPGLIRPRGFYEAVLTRHLSNQHEGHEERMAGHIARAEAAGARNEKGGA